MDPRELTGRVLLCSLGLGALYILFGLVQASLPQNHADQRFSPDDKHLWPYCFRFLLIMCANNLLKCPLKENWQRMSLRNRVVKSLLQVYFTFYCLNRFTVNSSSTVLSIYFTTDGSCVHLRINNKVRRGSKE